MDKLLNHIRSLTDFSDESWMLLQKTLIKVQFKKNELLLQEGEASNKLFYIEQGYCRCYYEADGKQNNTSFFFENEIAASPSSVDNTTKSKYNIVACEPLTAIVLDKNKLSVIAHDAVEIERMGRQFIRVFAAKQEEFADLIKFHAAEERLEYIEQRYPQMIQRIPLLQLAPFLGVTRETLSRIRSERTHK